MWYLIFPACGIIFLILFLKNRIKKASGVSLIFKALTSVCFMGQAFCGVWKAAADSDISAGFPLLILAGLFSGLLGDIWLDLKWNCPAENDLYTFAGFFSFAAGHVLFIAGLICGFCKGAGIMWVVLPLILAVILGVIVGMNGKIMHLDYGRFKHVTMLYSALLTGTMLLSGSLLIRSGLKNGALWTFFAGAVLFLISDLILSGTYFGNGKDRPSDIISNHVFYYAAQFLIAGSVLAYTGDIL